MADEGGARKPLKFAGARSRPAEPPARPWRVLVVDDDEEVLNVTKLVLRGKSVFGRGLEILEARSAREAEALLRAERDLACILLDVVMEENDSGLKVARLLREELGNTSTRIVLRTGQPGQAPEARVILEYEINDYKEKTELTEQKLFTTVVTAIRGYRDIVTIEESRKGMRMIIDASSSFFTLRSMDLFAAGILKELLSLLYISDHAIYGTASGLSVAERGGDFYVRAGTGRYADAGSRPLAEVLDGTRLALVERALALGEPLREGGALVVAIRNREGRRGFIYIDDCPPLDELSTQLLSLFCTNVSEAFSSISMNEALEASMRERELLVKEVHHRVRNNLQLVAGLINMALREGTSSPLDTLRQTGARMESMARVHSFVFSGSRYETVDFASFLPSQVNAIKADYLRELREAPVRIEAEGFVLPLTLALPCGLIMNELVVMALDRLAEAGPEAGLLIRLSGGGGVFRCRVAAEGLPPGGTGPFAEWEGTGPRLVGLLLKQVKGRMLDRPEDGSAFAFEFSQTGPGED